MGCGGSSLQDLSNQAKTAVSQAKDTAQANGLEKVEVLNTGKEALVAVKDKGVNLENLKDIADKNGIKSSELLNTGKDLLLATSKPEVDNIKMKDIQETKPRGWVGSLTSKSLFSSNLILVNFKCLSFMINWKFCLS